VTDERGPLITSEAVVAEADFLIMSRLGLEAGLAFLDDLAAGTFVVDCLSPTELKGARDLARKHKDLKLGLADASLVLLAQLQPRRSPRRRSSSRRPPRHRPTARPSGRDFNAYDEEGIVGLRSSGADSDSRGEDGSQRQSWTILRVRSSSALGLS
jgi:hypothetical protein